jgi:hypothetical protein
MVQQVQATFLQVLLQVTQPQLQLGAPHAQLVLFHLTQEMIPLLVHGLVILMWMAGLVFSQHLLVRIS